MFSVCISSHEHTDLFLEPAFDAHPQASEKVPSLLKSKKSLRDFRSGRLQRVTSLDQFHSFAPSAQLQNAPDEWRNF